MADCCRHKKDPRDEEEIKAIINRLNRIEGQIGGIRKMVEDNRYCSDIITQVSAVQSSLNSLTKEIMATHIKSCVVDDIKAGKVEAVDELCELLKKTMK